MRMRQQADPISNRWVDNWITPKVLCNVSCILYGNIYNAIRYLPTNFDGTHNIFYISRDLSSDSVTDFSYFVFPLTI